MTPLSLHPDIDVANHAAAFIARGHTRIRPFLADDAAAALHAHLRARDDWVQVVNSGDKVFELDRATRVAMTAAQRAALDGAVVAGARDGFQYRYETLRLPDGDDATGAGGPLPVDVTRFLSTGPARDLLQAVTGAADIAFVDGQATAYSPGDFLTGHDDAVTGKNRVAAYVLGLTPIWRLEWGGLLLFHDGDRVEGVSPEYNSLDLFAVPRLHSVSAVTSSAAYRRYSVTGWLRRGRSP